ncbi:hypothetical protein ACIF9R_28995 [Streptomyces sp. NPDC086080]|uniref:hypothetical protein n=1 Tax=Streptomyces sp. NPDC086080 TaxID=3365748 RepID=UPI0037CFDD75
MSVPVGVGAGVVLLLLALGVDGGARESPAGDGAVDRVAVGRECRSELEPGMELSCGTAGFGDLRQLCVDGERCVRTTAVTVLNCGRSDAFVSVISGPRPGVRKQGADHRLAPRGRVTLRPDGPGYLFDITLRAADSAPARLRIVRVK